MRPSSQRTCLKGPKVASSRPDRSDCPDCPQGQLTFSICGSLPFTAVTGAPCSDTCFRFRIICPADDGEHGDATTCVRGPLLANAAGPPLRRVTVNRHIHLIKTGSAATECEPTAEAGLESSLGVLRIDYSELGTGRGGAGRKRLPFPMKYWLSPGLYQTWSAPVSPGSLAMIAPVFILMITEFGPPVEQPSRAWWGGQFPRAPFQRSRCSPNP